MWQMFPRSISALRYMIGALKMTAASRPFTVVDSPTILDSSLPFVEINQVDDVRLRGAKGL